MGKGLVIPAASSAAQMRSSTPKSANVLRGGAAGGVVVLVKVKCPISGWPGRVATTAE
jgi:hypothetical protein